jgi:ribosome modulation factor
MSCPKGPLGAAYLKGLAAGLAGEPATACPYKDKRTWSGKLTWSRGLITAWHDGWKEATENREQALITAQYARPFENRSRKRKR